MGSSESSPAKTMKNSENQVKKKTKKLHLEIRSFVPSMDLTIKIDWSGWIESRINFHLWKS